MYQGLPHVLTEESLSFWLLGNRTLYKSKGINLGKRAGVTSFLILYNIHTHVQTHTYSHAHTHTHTHTAPALLPMTLTLMLLVDASCGVNSSMLVKPVLLQTMSSARPPIETDWLKSARNPFRSFTERWGLKAFTMANKPIAEHGMGRGDNRPL